MQSGAIFSSSRRYRYVLWRQWREDKPSILFIGLNPSTADERHNDPTITRCINFARDWGYGGLFMTNLFAYCAVTPGEMKAARKPIGEDNDYWLQQYIFKAHRTVLAWGNDGEYLTRDKEVLALIKQPYCLAKNQNGQPSHPLYLKKNLKLRLYN